MTVFSLNKAPNLELEALYHSKYWHIYIPRECLQLPLLPSNNSFLHYLDQSSNLFFTLTFQPHARFLFVRTDHLTKKFISTCLHTHATSWTSVLSRCLPFLECTVPSLPSRTTFLFGNSSKCAVDM